jgi:protein farnesyltransferase/geranylgeranyltransferase type-1 subunit alpha
MSDTSDDDINCGDDQEKTSWVLYRDRDDWKDVTPLAQDDGPHPIVAIAYSEKCKWPEIGTFSAILYFVYYVI